jgi:hypothetical protein
MDLGLDLIANPSKIKKRTYLANKKEGFDINEFILETVIDELNINTLNHPRSFLKNIIDFTLKVAHEDKNVDISHLENMKIERKEEDIEKLPSVLTKKISLSSKIIEKKEPKIDVTKLSNLPPV